MSIFNLDYRPWQRITGPALLGACCTLIALSPAAVPLRVPMAAAALAFGLALWQRHLNTRVCRLARLGDGRLCCTQANGREWVVARVVTGIVRPTLLSARLVGASGQRADLWIPAGMVAPETHRQLRALMLGFQQRPGRS